MIDKDKDGMITDWDEDYEYPFDKMEALDRLKRLALRPNPKIGFKLLEKIKNGVVIFVC